jgi:hypothetical protein
MGNWAGTWTVGAGYQVTISSPAYTFADPLRIRIGETSVFEKHLPTLAGVSRIFGKRNKYADIELEIAHNTAVAAGTICPDPPVSATVSVIPPSGTTQTGTGRLVSVSGPDINPEGELVDTIRIAMATVLA